jgi:hypothetical protein
MTRVKHEQDKLDFQDDIGGRKWSTKKSSSKKKQEK